MDINVLDASICVKTMKTVLSIEVNPKKENPLNYKYIRMLRLFCYSVGIWPGDYLDEKMSKVFHYYLKSVPLQIAVVFIGEVNYLLQRWKTIDFYTLGEVLINILLTIVTSVRIIYPNLRLYGMTWRRFIKDFHLGNYTQHGRNYEKVAHRMNKISHYYTLVMIPVIFLGVLLFNLSPLWSNISNGAFVTTRSQNVTLRFSVSYEFRGFKPEDNFELVTLLNLYLTYSCTIIICTQDLFLILLCLQIVGHQLVLGYNLDDHPKPERRMFLKKSTSEEKMDILIEKYSDEENELMHKLLVQSVLHHRYISCFVDDVSSFFGPMMGLIYLFDLTCFCLLFLECSQLNSGSLARFGPLTVISVWQLLQISIIFEIVGTMSEKIENNVYNLPWECMDLRNQRTFLIFFNRIQRTMHVTCMGIIPVGLQSMASVLKTCFSYYTFLRSMEI